MLFRTLRVRFDRNRPVVSLKGLLAVVFGFAGLASAAIVATAAQRESAQQLRDKIDAELQGTAQFIAERLDRAMFLRWRDMQIVTAMPALRNRTTTDEEIRVFLGRLKSTLTDYAWIGLAGPDGRIRVATDGLLEGQDASDRPWFKGSQNGPFAGDVHEALLLAKALPPPPDGEPIRLVDVAAPIRDDDGELIGVVAAHLHWGWAREITGWHREISRSANGPDALIISQDDRVLLGPRHLIGVPAVSLGSDGWLIGHAKTQGFRDYPGLGWRVEVRQSVEQALAPVNELTRYIMLWSVSVALALALAGFFLADQIVQPLARLSRAANRLSRGEIVPLPRASGYREAAILSGALATLVTNLRSANKVQAALVNVTSDGIWDWNVAKGTIRSSVNWATMLGFAPNETTHDLRGWKDRIHPDDVQAAWDAMMAHVNGRTAHYEHEHRLLAADGAWRWFEVKGSAVSRDATGRAQRVVGAHADITERKQVEERLLALAMHDPLTDLPNRTYFRERLQQAAAGARRSGATLAVLLLDLDQFKDVNDTLGHPAGDLLLIEVARRLARTVRANDTVARLGGDEFAILLEDVREPEDAASSAQRALEQLTEPFRIDGQEVFIGVSIGVTISPNDGDDPDTLFRNADLALYRAKAEARGGYQFYAADLVARVEARRRLERELRTAMATGQFELYYQPQFRLADRSCVGAEALLRWRHPERGLLAPGAFMHTVETTGLAPQLGAWILEDACRAAQTWPQAMTVAVNVSPAQMRGRADFPAIVAAALEASGLAPGRLKLELTEDALFLGEEDVYLEALRRLRPLGVKLAVDDLGTGHSGLSRLRRFPIDEIKIDRSFVAGVGLDRDDEAIVRAVIGLGQAMGHRVVAEGIETEMQLERLRQEGCEVGQGYLLGRPMPLDRLSAQLGHEGCPRAAAAWG
ncbi:bifunctional diguanylate cyclase/phosphodiesterase [Marinivivus vitaminiproducens]|uniref:bifunctional diguanylate cyclase/phosphodiesterase n=1 Tax=Marinivivus vitaminiproducens TaxID=3035935 RepID=UPI00279E9BB2|nr:EAL domain-containing protein [Geminicoccaceae bacterium SCSIO 64248]